jgi:hypothetical protein
MRVIPAPMGSPTAEDGGGNNGELVSGRTRRGLLWPTKAHASLKDAQRGYKKHIFITFA